MIKHLIFKWRIKKELARLNKEYIEVLERNNIFFKEEAYNYMFKYYEL